MFHCIGSHGMAWREMHLSHMKGGTHLAPAEVHGDCGLAGRPDHE